MGAYGAPSGYMALSRGQREERWSPVGIWGRYLLGRGSSQCKGPEARPVWGEARGGALAWNGRLRLERNLAGIIAPL